MNLEVAKANLVRAYVAAYDPASGQPVLQTPLAKMREQLSSLAAMLDADDPGQAQILEYIIAVSDELRLAERHCKAAERKLREAVVSVVGYESTIRKI